MPHLRTSLLTALTLAFAPVALAQRVYWDPPGGRLGLGKVEDLSLVFEECAPTDALELPAVPGLEFGRPSQAQQTSIVNTQMTTRVVLTYPARVSGPGDIVIPAFDAATNKGRIAVGEVRFVAAEAGVGPSGPAIGDIVSSQLRPSGTRVWVGELVNFEYLLSASTRYNVQLASHPEWQPAGLVLEPFEGPERVEATVGGERRQAVRYRTRGLFTAPGDVALDPARQLVNVQTGERAGFLFSQPRIEQFSIESSVLPVIVRPLPSPAPAGFSGAVGQFRIESTVVPETARIGEPVTWTLRLIGTGNWTTGLSLPAREASTDFQVVQPKSRVEMEEGRLFQGSLIEDAVLVPTAAGTYALGPVSFTWFDPAVGQYRTETVPATTVTIEPAAAPAITGPAAPATAPAAETPSAGPADGPLPDLPRDLAAPALLPGEPLPVGAIAAAPRYLAWGPLALGVLGTPLLVWFVLALVHAWRSAPVRERRRARKDLRQLLREVSRGGRAPDTATLERWRTLTARLWSIRRATPTLDDLAAALARTPGAGRAEAWLDLWREAEAAMFSATGTLAADWTTRAATAAAAARIHAGMAWWPARARHWAPRLATGFALAAALAASPKAGAAEARDAYREGRFAEAREAWLAHLARQPLDWAAHNNVALAQAQLDAWGHANAHMAAAFLLHPRHPDVRRHLRLAATHLDGVDPHLRRVLDPAWHDRPVAWLSPAEWQRLLLGGALVFGLALIALVASLHLGRGRLAVRATGQGTAVVGLLVVCAAALALWRYGPLAHPQAAMVVQPAQLQSIPSEVAEKAKSVPIAPGAIVRIEHAFLGWRRVSAPGASGGWIRRESLLPFYRVADRPPGS